MPLSTQPRSAYLHVPFCAHRCGYCNFAVVAGREDLADAFLQAICLELEELPQPCQLDTLYFGGGTPTRLGVEDLGRLCRLAATLFSLMPDYEWTVEANPGDVSARLVAMLAEQGVTRVSLGAQSFRDDKLAALERDHKAADIHRSVDLCKQHGLDVSIDLIFAAPGESLAQWQADLEQAIQLDVQHLSTYGLTFEKGTTFWSRLRKEQLEESPDELQREMYLAAIDTLSGAGFEHYEVSNFALPGRRSRHNEAYWSGAGYYAAGPGAARYVDGVRETNHRSTTTYLRRVLSGQSPVAEQECLSTEQRARERLVFGLRRLEGVSKPAFSEQTGYEINALAGPSIQKFVGLGLLRQDAERIALTTEGLLLSDAMWPELL